MRYVVISIVHITVTLSIELLYPTQLSLFFSGFFGYLLLFVPIGLSCILDKV